MNIKDMIIPTKKAREAMGEMGIDIPMKDTFMSVTEAAKYAGVHKNSIYRWTDKGLQCSFGVFLRIKQSDLDNWITARVRK